MRISIGHQFRDTNTKTVYTIVGTGLRNSYTLAIDGKSCGSIPRSMLLFNLTNSIMVYHGSVHIPKPNRIAMSNLLIEGA
jgi:hypothetical protein